MPVKRATCEVPRLTASIKGRKKGMEAMRLSTILLLFTIGLTGCGTFTVPGVATVKLNSPLAGPEKELHATGLGDSDIIVYVGGAANNEIKDGILRLVKNFLVGKADVAEKKIIEPNMETD